jgi:hypothetical protein
VKTPETPVRNKRHRNTYDIEVKLFQEDKWSLGGCYSNLADAQTAFDGYEERAGTVAGDCMFYSYARLMAPRQDEPLEQVSPSGPRGLTG